MKIVTLAIQVRVDDGVPDEEVAQQIGDAIGPDAWNWDVGFPEVIATSDRFQAMRKAHDNYVDGHGDADDLASAVVDYTDEVLAVRRP